MMTKGRTDKRLLSGFLALLMLLTMLPTNVLPVYSVESDSSAVPGASFGEYIGCNAEFNMGEYGYVNFLVFDDPASFDYDVDWDNDAYWLYADDLNPAPTLIITDYYWDAENYALWYKVEATNGSALPAKMETYPWVFQNYTDFYEEEDWETVYPDSLLIDVPEFGEPTNVVSSNGVTIITDNSVLTGFSIRETEAPSAYYISQAIAYDMTPRTEDGKYTGYAEVAIPIPEGWDTSRLYGFVVESDGSISAIPGTVTNHGTFCFTVPHFSEVGLLEATAVEDVKNVKITFGRIQTENIISLPGQVGEMGRHVSDDGNVQYVVNHVVLNDATTTYITFTGLDVTPGTEIILGDISVVVIVKKAEATVNKVLTGGSVANSATLDPLYDLIISGEFDISYSIDSGSEYITRTDNTITAVSGANGSATVTASVAHKTSKRVVGSVTYNVTITDANVTDVKRIYVPKGGTVNITSLNADLSEAVKIDEEIATATYEDSTLKITGVADSGETSVIVGTVLLTICAVPENPELESQTYVWFIINANPNCTIYYSINGGTLHKLESSAAANPPRVILVGLDMKTHQHFPDGFNIIFFGAPDDGYITSKMEAEGTNGQFYCLSNGSRYDGSDSDAWPLTDPNAQTIDGGARTDNFNKSHGLYGPLVAGNMTVAQMRDLFTRALALGCDSATTFTKNSNETFAQNITFTAERLPSFEKTIVAIKRKNGGTQTFDENNPYVAENEDPLEMGDTVTYQFAITITSQNITYWFDIADPSIGYSYSTGETGISTLGTHKFTQEYVVGETGGVVDPNKIKLYAEGQFRNEATLSYSYKSYVASGKTKTVATSSVTCRIGSIVTWKDNYGTVWAVKYVESGKTLPTVVTPSKDGYKFEGWDFNVAGLTKDGDSYIVNYGAEKSITILGNLSPIIYYITYVLDNGALPDETDNPMAYTIRSLITLPAPTKEGYDFAGWKVTKAEEIWTENAVYSGDTVLLNRYGNVTMEALWTPVITSITIQVSGCDSVDENQTFLFRITDEKGLDLTVTVHGNSSVKVEGFTFGEKCTIQQITDWSWRYNVSQWNYGDQTETDATAEIQIVLDGTVIFTNTRAQTQWLDGNSWLDNLFDGT